MIVGGGPVGLFLAAELRLAGASVLVVERLAEPDPVKDGGDRGVQARTLQTLRLRGLLPTILARAASHDAPGIAEFSGDPGTDAPDDLRILLGEWGTARMKGHFAFLPLLDTDGALADVPTQLPVRQGDFERVLEERARELGALVRRGQEVATVGDSQDGVVATFADGRSVRGTYLVGCDGGHSVVRKAAGFDFPGTDPALVALLGSAELAQPLAPGVRRTPHGLLLVDTDRIVTVEFDVPVPDHRVPVTAKEFEDSLRRVSGVDVTVTRLHNAIRVTDNARQVPTYRREHVLLAGDAAHVHSPMGGQGLNLGLQDAANLGWKLGLVVRGLAPESLLDTYTTERHPIGARVLRDTRAQTALLRPGQHTDALREVMADLIDLPAAKRHLVEQSSGLSIRYQDTGDFFPADLTDGRGLLLDPTPDRRFANVAAGWADRVHTAEGPQAMIVRPDGYVVWAGDGDPREALTRWFGPAA